MTGRQIAPDPVVLIAPDAFKGSLSAQAVADHLARGIKEVWPQAELRILPLADGGEGTVAVLVAATGGRLLHETVTGPLGTPVEAQYGMLGDGETAVIEMAAASGLTLVPPAERNPLRTTTYGTGELMQAAMAAGARRLIVGIGGSATVDGGAGMAQALGYRLLREDGETIGQGGGALSELAVVEPIPDPARRSRLAQLEVDVACDVDNPLTGPQGAAAVFGPQKGADEAMVRLLDGHLSRFAAVIARDLGAQVAELPGAGAAGGLGAGLVAFTGARLVSGIERVLHAVDFTARLADVDLVITGEGRLDAQTARGKVPFGVARAVGRHRADVPVVAVAGSITDAGARLEGEVLSAALPLAPGPIALTEAMDRAGELLEQAGRRLAHLLAAGGQLSRRRRA